jgi:hypothetical protein
MLNQAGLITGFGVGILTTARSITATTSALKIAAPPILPIALYAFQRGAYGRCHLRAGCQHHLEQAIPGCWLEGEVAVYNLTNQQKKLSVNQTGNRGRPLGNEFLWPTSFQSPRYAQLVVSLNY